MSNYTNTSPLTSDVSEVHGLIGVGDNNSSVLLDPLSLISTASDTSTIDIDITGNVISASIIPSSISSTHLSSDLLTAINKGDTAIQPSSLGNQVQAFNNNLQSISNIDSGTGLLKRLSSGNWELDTNTSYNSASGVAKAWINFNGTGTIAVRSSSNISFITDNGPGDYTLNFINPMSRTDYCVVVTTDTPGIIATATSLLANSVNIQTSNTSSVLTDVSSIHVVVFA